MRGPHAARDRWAGSRGSSETGGTQKRRTAAEAIRASRLRPGPHAAFEVTPINDGCPAAYHLAVQRLPVSCGRARVNTATLRLALTPRQAEVLRLLGEGATNLQIAAALGCSERTTEVHVGAILARAQVANRARLIANILSQDAP